jgi:hypothetical protein
VGLPPHPEQRTDVPFGAGPTCTEQLLSTPLHADDPWVSDNTVDPPRTGQVRGFAWAALAMVGAIVLALLSARFFARAGGLVGGEGLDSSVLVLIALPWFQLGVLAGAGIAATWAGRSRAALKWCGCLVWLFVVIDGLFLAYLKVAACVVTC